MTARVPTKRVLAIFVAALAACGDATGVGGTPREPEDVTFAASLGIDLQQMSRLASGVYIQTVMPGTGDLELTEASDYSMDYVVWLPDGSELDRGTVRTEITPSFIEGWELGVIGMKLHEVRMLVLPSRLAYGDGSGTPVPPHSVLVFRVTLAGLR